MEQNKKDGATSHTPTPRDPNVKLKIHLDINRMFPLAMKEI